LSATIQGFVIGISATDGEVKGVYLDGHGIWREVPLSEAYVHPAETINDVRLSLQVSRNKPKFMRRAMRASWGVTIPFEEPATSFYPSTSSIGDQPSVGDCLQLIP